MYLFSSDIRCSPITISISIFICAVEMSEPQLPNPIPQAQEPASSPNSPDPLLERGSYIDPPQNNSAESPQPAGNPEFPPGVVIAAEPISMYLPGEDSPDPPPSARRRNRDEMAKRPTWLPEDWTIDLRVRSSGATAGLIDRVCLILSPNI